MNKYLLSVALAALGGVSFSSVYASTVYGTQTGGLQPGIVSFSTEGSSPETVWQSAALTSTYGAVFTDDAVYMSFKDTYSRYCTKATHNGEFGDWTSGRINDSLKVTDIPSALGWDAITGIIYGSFLNADQTTYSWGQFSTSNATSTVITPLENQLVSIAVNPTGAIYAIDVNGDLYSVTAAGELTKIGATGVVPSPKFAAGLIFDPDTDILYWTPTTKSLDTSLYTVNVASGAATKVYDFPENTRLTSLYIQEAPAPAGAPADVTDFLALPDGFNNKLDISFTLPTKTQAGQDMLGAVKYKVMVDQDVIADTQGGPGQAVNLTATPGDGEHVVTLNISNKDGKANRITSKVYVGADAPGAVTDLKISADDKTITLTWSAPVTGENGGNFDAANLRYDVVRVNDNELVGKDLTATSFTETVDPQSLEKFSYTVTPKCGDLTGPSATTPSVLIGDGMTPPYDQNFDSADSFDEIYFSTYDANKDGKGWTLYKNYYGTAGNARYTYSPTNDADDWLFTCPLSLQAGHKYDLTFSLSCNSWGEGEKLGVSYGEAPDVESMTEEALPVTDFAKGFNGTVSAELAPAKSGTYYVGFHIASVKDSYNVDLDNVKVEAGVPTGVAMVQASQLGVRGVAGAIEITSDEADAVEVFDLKGICCAQEVLNAGLTRVELPAGIYLVKIKGAATKVVVK